ncbi:methyltransferase domain-containing protein [Streptomyces sp. ms191]|uniref:HemK2/MTQ2 family protein methyltransferase n=1 Tax=Streptomyces sp. ms191 TaxID=1827978 RepID=UPI0011CDFFE8|nr:HemK2/MTQ2 family protein methyltransferase [Streptomyces sp. ms191]TXS16218.1 methyltransferase domain-containing protein [Streptomyces sp. ms191]
MTTIAPTYPTLTPGLVTPPGVYRPQADTLLLARALAREPLDPGADVVEIGTGTGALALRAAARGAQVTAVDVSWLAVLTARLNSRLQRLPLRVLHGDFAGRTQGRRFDLVLSNPPYVPSPADRLPTHGPARAWDAGNSGRRVIDRICAAAPTLLRPEGVLLMVHSGMCGAQDTVGLLQNRGLVAEVTERASVPWGPVLRSRRAWLREQGLASEGAEQEELVVVRARRS